MAFWPWMQHRVQSPVSALCDPKWTSQDCPAKSDRCPIHTGCTMWGQDWVQPDQGFIHIFWTPSICFLDISLPLAHILFFSFCWSREEALSYLVSKINRNGILSGWYGCKLFSPAVDDVMASGRSGLLYPRLPTSEGARELPAIPTSSVYQHLVACSSPSSGNQGTALVITQESHS